MIRFRFNRFSDQFLPDMLPSESVRFAVCVNPDLFSTARDYKSYEYKVGHTRLATAIIAAGAYLTLGYSVVISCRDTRELLA